MYSMQTNIMLNKMFLTKVDRAEMESTLQALRIYFHDETDQAGRNSECSFIFPNVNDFGKSQNYNILLHK